MSGSPPIDVAALTERVAALEREFAELKATCSVVQAPLRVMDADGRLLVEIAVDLASGGGKVQLFSRVGEPVATLIAQEDGGWISTAGRGGLGLAHIGVSGSNGYVEVYGAEARAALQTTEQGGGLTVSGANGNDGAVLGPGLAERRPALTIMNQAGDHIAVLGPDDSGAGRLRLLDQDGWGLHDFPKPQ